MRKKCIILFKDAVFVAFFLSLARVSLLTFGLKTTKLLEATFYIPPVVAVCAIALSYILHYCILHRICIGYVGAVSWAVYHNRYIGFGNALNEVLIALLIVGVCITIKLIDYERKEVRKRIN